MNVSIVYLRAISIIFILISHSYGLANINMQALTFTERVFVSLLGGGTVFFVFISGFLFHQVFIPRYQFKKFMIGKLKNLLIPYLILSTPLLLLFLSGVDWAPLPAPDKNATFYDYLSLLFRYLVSGNTVTAYWYIPFILAMFLLSPAHLWFAKTTTIKQLVTISCLLTVSAYLHRPMDTYHLFHSLLYFFPVYLIGIFCSVQKVKIYELTSGKEYYFLILAFSISVYQAMNGEVGWFRKEAFEYNGIDTSLFNKLLLCMFFMVWLNRFATTSNKIFDFIANISFSLFFLHGYLIIILVKLQKDWGKSIFNFSPWINLFLVAILMIAVISLISITIKKLLPKHSKYLIGY